MIDRYLTEYIKKDLKEKMVFIGGPRQVGKTTLAIELVAKSYKNPAYYNWDFRESRKNILNSKWPADAELIILDEIHKYKKWKSHIKGQFDTLKSKYKFLVTGSARMDIYRKGSDSLQGRYHHYRLHPFSITEIIGLENKLNPGKELEFPAKFYPDTLQSLDKFGGFPEPFTKQNNRSLRRWHNEKLNRLFREDIRDLEQIRDLDNMRLLCDTLPQKVGSLLSLNSIREDIEVSHRSVTSWLSTLESFYYCFRIYPFISNSFRSLKKEAKLFLWDWSEVDEEAARFENLVAAHLLKFVNFLYDYEGYKAELYYLRNADKKEVDFLVTINKKPWFAVEVKLNDKNISPNLFYYKEKLKIPFIYQVIKPDKIDFLQNGARLISASKFLAGLV